MPREIGDVKSIIGNYVYKYNNNYIFSYGEFHESEDYYNPILKDLANKYCKLRISLDHPILILNEYELSNLSEHNYYEGTMAKISNIINHKLINDAYGLPCDYRSIIENFIFSDIKNMDNEPKSMLHNLLLLHLVRIDAYNSYVKDKSITIDDDFYFNYSQKKKEEFMEKYENVAKEKIGVSIILFYFLYMSLKKIHENKNLVFSSTNDIRIFFERSLDSLIKIIIDKDLSNFYRYSAMEDKINIDSEDIFHDASDNKEEPSFNPEFYNNIFKILFLRFISSPISNTLFEVVLFFKNNIAHRNIYGRLLAEYGSGEYPKYFNMFYDIFVLYYVCSTTEKLNFLIISGDAHTNKIHNALNQYDVLDNIKVMRSYDTYMYLGYISDTSINSSDTSINSSDTSINSSDTSINSRGFIDGLGLETFDYKNEQMIYISDNSDVVPNKTDYLIEYIINYVKEYEDPEQLGQLKNYLDLKKDDKVDYKNIQLREVSKKDIIACHSFIQSLGIIFKSSDIKKYILNHTIKHLENHVRINGSKIQDEINESTNLVDTNELYAKIKEKDNETEMYIKRYKNYLIANIESINPYIYINNVLFCPKCVIYDNGCFQNMKYRQEIVTNIKRVPFILEQIRETIREDRDIIRGDKVKFNIKYDEIMKDLDQSNSVEESKILIAIYKLKNGNYFDKAAMKKKINEAENTAQNILERASFCYNEGCSISGGILFGSSLYNKYGKINIYGALIICCIVLIILYYLNRIVINKKRYCSAPYPNIYDTYDYFEMR